MVRLLVIPSLPKPTENHQVSSISLYSPSSQVFLLSTSSPPFTKCPKIKKNKKSPHEVKKPESSFLHFFAASVHILSLKTWTESLASKIHRDESSLTKMPSLYFYTITSLSFFILYSPQQFTMLRMATTPFFKNMHSRESKVVWNLLKISTCLFWIHVP